MIFSQEEPKRDEADEVDPWAGIDYVVDTETGKFSSSFLFNSGWNDHLGV